MRRLPPPYRSIMVLESSSALRQTADAGIRGYSQPLISAGLAGQLAPPARIPSYEMSDRGRPYNLISQNTSCVSSGRAFVEQLVIELLCPLHQVPRMLVLRTMKG